jgi:hypothetical protein
MMKNRASGLIKKSELKTSDNFTDFLMQRIEEKEFAKISRFLSFKTVLASLISLMLICTSFLFLKEAPYMRIFMTEIVLPKTPLYFVSLTFFLLFINKIYSLNKSYEELK